MFKYFSTFADIIDNDAVAGLYEVTQSRIFPGH